MSKGRALQDVSGFGRIQARYFRIGLAVMSAIYVVQACEPDAATALRVARLAMAVAALGAVRWLPSERAPSENVMRGVLLLIHAVTLAVAWTEAPRGFPFNLLLLPGFAVLATILGGARFGALVVAASAVFAACLFSLVSTGEPRGRLMLEVVNLGISTAVMYAYARLLSSLLGEGVSVLRASVDALQATRETTKRLSQDLSERVTSAVAGLAAALDRGQDAGPALSAVSAVLDESRRVLPAEPALPEIDMPARLLSMRRSLATWSLRLVLLGVVANVLVQIVWPTRFSGVITPGTLLLVTVLLLSVVDAMRPHWFAPLSVVLHLAAMAMLIWATLRWFDLQPGLPSTATFWGLFAVLATAVVGPHLGALELGLGTACLMAGALHPGFDWTLPWNLLLSYGLSCALVHDIPRQLVAQLSQWRAEAASEIRRRRRLVATLFHDLANPLTVVQSALMLVDEGRAEPDDVTTMREMVGRMQRILEAATGQVHDLGTVSAGHLFRAMDRLFAERLRSKGVALKTHGPAQAQIACRETLLTESVLGNLVSNALKFSPAGADIDLSVETGPDSVVIAVEDRGPGLPADVRESLATGGSSVSRPGTGGEQGHGHGLMLAQEYVREMGGSLELAERVGGGLSARIVLKAG